MAPPKMTLEDWLDDLCVRFINNLPEADLTSMARICFLVEEAHWFYEDFIRPLDPTLPSMTLRNFCLTIFQRCPLLAPFPIQDHIRAFEEFLKYKISVPVRGAILLNETMEYALLVKGWKKGANWSFPKGKINMDEDDLDCAIREVFEETGFDVREAGLVPPPGEVKFIETTFRDQQLRLYVFRDVPMDTYFEPQTRKEISKIEWYKISDLPIRRKNNNNNNNNQDADDMATAVQSNKFYMVAPFMVPLKKWIGYQRKRDAYRAGKTLLAPQPPMAEELLTEDETGGAPSDPQYIGYQTAPPEGILDCASRELQRLLRIQPPSSAPAKDLTLLPSNSSNPGQNKADALLAMLQNGGSSALKNESHTPLDHVYSQAPLPESPRHRHPQHHFSLQQQQEHSQNQQQAPFAGYTAQGQQYQHQNQYQQPQPPPFQLQGPPPQSHGQGIPGPQYSPYGGHGGPPGHPDLQQQQQQQQTSRYPYQQQQQHHQTRLVSGYPSQGPPDQYPNLQQNQHGQQTQRHPQPPAPLQQQQQQQPPRPPIPLLHPQPLPPTVQKGLLARESFASPDVTEATSFSDGRGFVTLVGPPPSLPPQEQQLPPQVQQPAVQRPPLGSHAATLLQAFRSSDGSSFAEARHDDGASGWQQRQKQQLQQREQQSSQSPQPPPPPQHYGGTLRQHGQQHQLYGSHPQPGPQPQPQQQAQPVQKAYNSGLPAATLPPSAPFSGPVVSQNQPQSMDSHRTALLDIFKQPSSPQQPQKAAPTPPLSNQQQRHQQQPQKQTHSPASRAYGDALSTGQRIEAAAQANGGPIEMNPNLNLPFGALSLLTRPRSGSTGPKSPVQTVQVEQPQQQYLNYNNASYNANSSHDGAITSAASSSASAVPDAAATRQTSLLNLFRGTASSSPQRQKQQAQSPLQQSVPHHNNAPRRSSAISAVSTSTAVAAAAASSASSSHTHYAHHSQRIQSMSPAATIAVADTPAGAGDGMQQTTASMRVRPDVATDQKQKLLSLFGRPQLSPTASVSSRGSREASIAAGSGIVGSPASISRRGSAQTPISPADRNFLLGYLASATKP